ncbi:TonB-dependent receptor [Parerythrobacter aestuarii]|uniref:TonB-dependent receptor n=1 Tax=Parerythrobacter aestuarii TaxID=3020909 RepID=UPI0024DE5D45|nr:TonB-dependent receptor [Parerythrobacter aestuarii]
MTAAMPALAQDTEGAQKDDGNIIIVTAQFREQNIQDTPLAITAVTADMIEAKSQTNLAQVADAAPNVAIRPQGASFGPSVTASIRGVGQNDFNPAFEPGVGIYIDDVYYPQLTGAIFDLLDVERVEILRGPQGTLTGRNSAGGAIKFYSRKPTGDNTGFLEATYGSRNRIGLRGAADFGFTDNLFMRVSGVFKEQDGYVDRIDYGCAFPNSGIPSTNSGAADCVLSELGGTGYQAVRGILRWEPSDRFEATLSADYVKDDRTIAGEVLLNTGPVPAPNTAVNGVELSNQFICGPFCNYATTGQPAITWQPALNVAPPGNPPFYIDPLGAAGTPLAATSGNDRSIYEGWGVSLNMVLDISDNVQLTSITGYREFDTEFYTDDDLTPINTNFGRNFLSNESFSQELRLNIEPADGINITVGGYYFEQDSVYDSFQDIRYVSVFPLQFRQPDPTAAEAIAVFGNIGWELTDRLTVNAGVRYTDESKDQTYFRLNLDGTINPFLDPLGAINGAGTPGALTGNTASYSADKLDYRVAVDYRWSDALLTYISVSTGFKGGGSNPRPFNAAQLIPFNPEKVTAFEAGFKSDFADNRVRLNGAVFMNDYTDLQIPVSACPTAPCAARLNAGDAEVWGIELEFVAEPVDGLNIDAAVSYIDQELKTSSLNPAATNPSVEISPGVFGTNPAGVVPTDPPAVPQWKFNAGIQYKADLGGSGSITPRLDLAYQDKQYTGPTTLNGVRTLNFMPSFTTLNGRLTWRNANEDLSVSLEVTNITDEYYFLSRFNLLGAGAGFDKALPAAPREWALTVRKDF